MIAGVDEAGRGCLAGSVFAAAVVFSKEQNIPKVLKDSKKMTVLQRERVAKDLMQHSLAWSLGVATSREIEAINILQASLLAMKRAVQNLTVLPDKILIDGSFIPDGLSGDVQAIVRGDHLIPEISAASVLAKYHRDMDMERLDRLYPYYRFAKHKGYGTRLHLDMLAQHGVSPEHRKSFAPVKALLESEA